MLAKILHLFLKKKKKKKKKKNVMVAGIELGCGQAKLSGE